LEILSLEGSVIEQLPKEIGQLTRLRLLDLSTCNRLQVVSPGVISSLKTLEELRMRRSFKNWKAAGDGSNAGLFELSHLSQLTALEVHVPNADILPADFLSHHELKRFQIMIGDGWFWDYNKNDRTLNTLKLKLTTTSIELERGLKKLLKICDDLSLDGTESVNHIVRQLDSQDCPQVRHLRVRDNVDFEYIRNKVHSWFLFLRNFL
jgi:Leucine-rich repeat (LRR) protein